MGILAIITLVAASGCFGYFIYKMTRILKDHVIGQEKYKIEGKNRLELLILVGLSGALLAASAVSGFIAKDYMHTKAIEYIAVIFGALLFGSALTFAIGAFMLYYYKLDLDEKQKKFCRYAWPLGFVVMVLALWLYTEGVAWHVAYPLISGFSTRDGALIGGEISSGGLQIKFYGIVIVSGALLCYAITDHMTYKKFKKHGLIDTLFVVAFIFGILGARLWYCLVLEPKLYLANPGYILMITDGGLAVQGGAILGITAGVTFMLLFRKYIDVRFMMDVAIPTILLAQVAGRWGNFFNQEVYGQVTTWEKLWYLPTIVRRNMLIDGDYRVPLFFIEGTMNLVGYFFIRYFLGKVCKFRIGLGYQAASYIAWYGMVRVILEPLRNGEFEYGQSWYVAFGMLGAGLLGILGFYILHRIRMEKGLEDENGDKIKTAENS